MKTGKPYVMFGDGQLASCKPISEADLASFMAECVKDPRKANQVLPVGGTPFPILHLDYVPHAVGKALSMFRRTPSTQQHQNVNSVEGECVGFLELQPVH